MVRSIIGRLKGSLRRTREELRSGLDRVLRARAAIDDLLFDELFEVLITADVGVAPTERILDRVRSRVRSEGVRDPAQIPRLLREEVEAMLEAASPSRQAPSDLVEEAAVRSARTRAPREPGATDAGASASGIPWEAKGEAEGGAGEEVRPRVVMVVGVNGTGKTTTIGKLARRSVNEGEKVLVAACDTYRAAAAEQLQIWAERAGVEMVSSQSGADPASVAYDAVSSARAKGTDLLLIDTAGRLHTKTPLMEELRKMKRVLGRLLPGAPHDILLVLDATTGQNGLSQCREFHEALTLTGLVLAKLDGTAKGGIVIAAAEEFKIPVQYVGTGEGIEDIEAFDAKAFAEGLFAE
jgi:fused signal recognition particle receptor